MPQYDPSTPQDLIASPVRSPRLALLIGTLVLLGGIALLVVTIVHLAGGTVGVTPWVLLPIVIIVLAGGGGVAVGIIRARWSRRYLRATGQPLREEPTARRDPIVR